MHSAPLRLLRIAILCCDEPVGETKKRYGGFGNLFRELFEKAALQVVQEGSHDPLKLNISTYDVLNGRTFPRLEDIDAILLTGSRYDSYSAGTNGWILRLVKFIEQVLYEQSRVRVIGVCFGHQIIGRALGVMPARSNSGWEVSVTEVELTATGRQLFGTESLAIHQMHRDALPSCPADVECLGSSPRCPVQGLYSKSRLTSMQGHPEYNAEIAGELMDLRRGILLSEETFGDGKSRVQNPHDGEMIAATFLRFLLDD